MSGHAVTYTGSNVDEIAELGVHVVAHPTQDAIIVFARESALDPVGTIVAGQVVIVDDAGVRIAGSPETPPLPVPADIAFDPTKAKVGEVLEYLRNLGDDPAEVERVLQLERAGKARKSIVGDGTVPEQPARQVPTTTTPPEDDTPTEQTEIPTPVPENDADAEIQSAGEHDGAGDQPDTD